MNNFKLTTTEKTQVRAALRAAGLWSRTADDCTHAYTLHFNKPELAADVLGVERVAEALTAEADRVELETGTRPVEAEKEMKQALAVQAVEKDALANKVAEPAPVAAPAPAQAAQVSPDAAAQLQALLGSLIPAPAAPVVDEAVLVKLIKEHATTSVELKPFDGGAIKTIKGAHKDAAKVIKLMNCRSSDGFRLQPYLVGEAGSGKTTLAKQAADALGLEFYSTGAVMASYELIGMKNAKGEYIPTALYTAFKQGGVFLLDEIDSCSAKALNCINQILANGHYTFPNGERVEKHVDFVAVAGANTIGHGATRQYIGRAPLDGATLDRFITVEMDYDEKLEKRLALAAYKANGGTIANDAEFWISLVQDARKAARKLGLPAIISPRTTINGASMLAAGFTTTQVENMALYGKLTDDQTRQIKAAL